MPPLALMTITWSRDYKNPVRDKNISVMQCEKCEKESIFKTDCHCGDKRYFCEDHFEFVFDYIEQCELFEKCAHCGDKVFFTRSKYVWKKNGSTANRFCNKCVAELILNLKVRVPSNITYENFLENLVKPVNCVVCSTTDSLFNIKNTVYMCENCISADLCQHYKSN